MWEIFQTASPWEMSSAQRLSGLTVLDHGNSSELHEGQEEEKCSSEKGAWPCQKSATSSGTWNLIQTLCNSNKGYQTNLKLGLCYIL